MSNKTFIQRDLSVVWHPCTQMKDHEWLPMIPIKRGEGVWLEDYDGNRYLDAISSWWVNLFGHANPHINAAIKQQIDKLEHVILAGFTHEPVIQLSEKLKAITPDGLDHVFYAENGSSAVEIALKMSFQYWQNLGQHSKTKFINLSNSYHGETLGALSVGDVDLYKQTFKPLLLDVITAPSPEAFNREDGETSADYALRKFADMEKLLQQHAHEVSAVIVEPLVQCAGYMRMYDAVYLTKLREACDHYQVHLIADEIAVGFGRTGKMFACEHANITPDFMCLSKGLTGGYLPLSAVLTHGTIYRAFYDDYTKMTGFLHSHSYTGNPLACTAALATLDIFQRDKILDKNMELINHLKEACQRFTDHPHVAEVRQTGMIVAIEMVKNKTTKEPYPWQERRGLDVYKHALQNNVLLRPLGNVVYFIPPYVISKEQINQMINVAWQGIKLATQD